MPPAPLQSFLQDPARAAGTLQYNERQGFLFAIASAPELIRPSEWMRLVFGDAEPEYASLDEARVVTGEPMSLYNAVNASVNAGSAVLPTECVFRDDVLPNLDDDAPIAQWSHGFMHGHRWLEELWNSLLRLTEHGGTVSRGDRAGRHPRRSGDGPKYKKCCGASTKSH